MQYITIQKYRFKRLLTRDPSDTSSLEYIIITNYTVSFQNCNKKSILYSLLLLYVVYK